MPDEYLLKICITGLTSLKDDFARTIGDSISPIAEIEMVMTRKSVLVNGKNVKLILVIKQESTVKFKQAFYQGSAAGIITFDKGDRASFDVVQDLIQEATDSIRLENAKFLAIQRRHPQLFPDPLPSTPLVLIGLISDSDTITKEEGQTLAEELGISYYETRPTDQETIEKIFHTIIRDVLKEFG